MTSLATRWYIACFLREALPIFPVYALMMTRHGITPLQLSTLFIVWSGTAAIAEVPTGMLADLVTRRWLLALSCLLRTFAFLLWLVVPQFWSYCAGFVLWGIASSLWSGTAEALLFETLAERNATHTFPTIYARGAAMATIGIALGLATGGWLATFGFALPVLISAALPLLTATLLLTMFGNPPRTATAHDDAPSTPLAQALRDFRTNADIRALALLFAGVLSFAAAFDEYFSLLLDAVGQNLTSIGLIFAAIHGVRAISMAAAARFTALGPLPISVGAGAVLLAALGSRNAAAIIVSCVLYFGLSAFAEVRASIQLQTTMSGAARATVTSLASFGPHVTEVGIFLLIGWLTTGRDYTAAAWVAGIGTTLVAALLWMQKWRAAHAMRLNG